ncbi:MAG TPA: hypothetical protein VGJ77_11600, partial [Gaiellaceae bacterium]
MGLLRTARTRVNFALLFLAAPLTLLAPSAASFSVASSAATDGLVAAYAFDEGSGSSVADASGGGNVGSVTNASWAAGKTGGALAFSGSSSYVTVADRSALDLVGALT